MQRLLLLLAVAGLGVVAGVPGCPDSQPNTLASPTRTSSYFACKVCLADDGARCASFTPNCGDSSERMDSETGAKDALCDILSPAELARRPTPPGFKPSPWLKNACYAWPADAFMFTCTRFTKTCQNVPIH